MKNLLYLFLTVFLLILNDGLFSQSSELFIPLNIQQAYQKNTRAYDGAPGEAYWQNRADYDMDIEFDPLTRLLKGTERILYHNNSPDTLQELFIHLFPDLYKRGNPRDFLIRYQDESEGIVLYDLKLNGRNLDPGGKNGIVHRGHSGMRISLPAPLQPGHHITLDILWRYHLNMESHIRTGAVDSSSFFIAYFFPRMAVYDDITGWNDFKYTGGVEFYNDYGDFDVSISVPRDFVVWATGEFQNPEEVLQEKYLRRYRIGAVSDSVIHIIDSTEYLNRDITRQNSRNIWHFRAKNVTDFAFALSDHYLWDAASVVVDKGNGRRVMMNAAYNINSKDFRHTIPIGLKGLDFMSRTLPGVPFPYPQITVFNSLDEMEYPMMVNLVSYNNFHSTIRVTLHEMFHSYFPFYVGCNETLYAWMDEGLTTFATYVMAESLYTPEHAALSFYGDYQGHIGDFIDIPVFVVSDVIKRPVYYFSSYTKPAVFLLVLRDMLGADLFDRTLREFINRWNGKHPQPYDLFFTFMDVTGHNLDWFIRPWIFEYGYVDLAIGTVMQGAENCEITIENRGGFPSPIDLQIEYQNGKVSDIHRTAAIWKAGNSEVVLKVPITGEIRSILLRNSTLLDAVFTNNRMDF
ncbi:MAG: M1 family peptidase [Calditrichaeota bacterium]|nr:M1 family metallopeptidase [Calditrichota bacterium]RQW03418.1 MAG: M1 family peptidase [Calditrichota bacterium]